MADYESGFGNQSSFKAARCKARAAFELSSGGR